MRENKMVMSEAHRRWVRVGPYYAMFPVPYVEETIRKYTRLGDAVLDPFAGRFSTIAVANYLGRPGCGIEISPLGWLYGRVKLNPAQRCRDVLRRVRDMWDASSGYDSEAADMNEFFHMCYSTNVRRFLLACRNLLNWKESQVDATMMASLMVVLHHNRGKGLSNQMRQMKAMAPRYSINWWKRHGMEDAPEVDPVEFLSDRIRWRYQHGVFRCTAAEAIRGDCCTELATPHAAEWVEGHDRIKLLFTSPPYWSLVNYFKDRRFRMGCD